MSHSLRICRLQDHSFRCLHDNSASEPVLLFKTRFPAHLHVSRLHPARNPKLFDAGLGFLDESHEEIPSLFIFLLSLHALHGRCCIRIGGRIFTASVGMVTLCYGDLKGGWGLDGNCTSFIVCSSSLFALDLREEGIFFSSWEQIRYDSIAIIGWITSGMLGYLFLNVVRWLARRTYVVGLKSFVRRSFEIQLERKGGHGFGRVCGVKFGLEWWRTGKGRARYREEGRLGVLLKLSAIICRPIICVVLCLISFFIRDSILCFDGVKYDSTYSESSSFFISYIFFAKNSMDSETA